MAKPAFNRSCASGLSAVNQGFFTKLLIHQNGTVQCAELTEPFAQLLAPGWYATARDAQNAPDASGRLSAGRTPDATPPAPHGVQGRSSGGKYVTDQRVLWKKINQPRAVILSGVVHRLPERPQRILRSLSLMPTRT